MGRKRNPYIQLFTRDILSSPRCRALSESAAGVYLFLLCRLNEPPTPGAYRISDWELHPTWKRSKTQQCLATPDKYERLPFFAAMLSKNDLPWRQASILAGLQELYKYGIIVIEGDMLVQPRMYKDNKFSLPDSDQDGDPVSTILDNPDSNLATREFADNNGYKNGAEISTDLGTKKVQEKVRVSRAHATRALSVENMSINNNSIGNIGGVGDVDAVQNPVQKPRKGDAGVDKGESDGKNKRRSSPSRPPVSDNPPSLADIQAYFDEMAAKGRPFCYVTPESFFDACEQSGWRLKDGKPMVSWQARVRTFENFRKEHGDMPVGQRPSREPAMKQGVQVTEVTPDKFKEDW